MPDIPDPNPPRRSWAMTTPTAIPSERPDPTGPVAEPSRAAGVPRTDLSHLTPIEHLERIHKAIGVVMEAMDGRRLFASVVDLLERIQLEILEVIEKLRAEQ